jgi:hypothetical protein
MRNQLHSVLADLGYDLTVDGIERAYLDGVVTEHESVELADTLDGGNAPVQTPKPVPFKQDKFARALSRFTIASLGDTEDEAYQRFHYNTERLHPAVVMRGPDGRWYAFGNRGQRRDKKQSQPRVLRGGISRPHDAILTAHVRTN